MLDDTLIGEAHEHYLEVKSLPKTSAWLKAEYDISISRQKLSQLFRKRGLWVRTRSNQYTFKFLEERQQIRDPYLRLAADVAKQSWADIKNYLLNEGSVSRINFLSACSYIHYSRLYRNTIASLLQESGIPATEERLNALVPSWCSQEIIEVNAKEYRRRAARMMKMGPSNEAPS